MAYSKSSGKPFEYASKISHRHLVVDEEVQDYIKNCVIPFDGKDVNLNPRLIHDIKYPSKNRIENIIAVDGGYQTVAVKKNFPSSLLTYFQFGELLLERHLLENLKAMPFISPKDMAELKNLSPVKLVLPTKNLILKDQNNLTDAVRKVIYEFFLKKDKGKDSLLHTLYWLLFQKYKRGSNTVPQCNCGGNSFKKAVASDDFLLECDNCETKAYKLSKCPYCEEPSVLLREDKMDKENYKWQCEKCKQDIYITDVFRLFEAVDNELGAGGIIGYIISAVENLLIVHIIKILLNIKKGCINKFLLVKDGPLSFVGQTANMHKPMRALLNYISQDNKINLVGIEKSGAFVDHAKEIQNKLKPGQVFLLDNEHIYTYVMPGNIDKDIYAKTSYYSAKFIYKSKEEKVYVLTVPVDNYNYYITPEVDKLKNLEEILLNIDLLKCDIYQDAIIPIALVNKLISLSNYPSSNILETFSKSLVK
ncbi:DNA double-strand break repair nuclease NurA [Marinifilum fragile]|uniref:DNA double-strand break repair nuclease NurA n=1 Tax=Marinifilum fragile TaxID=570161 RepID=UPI002AA8233F|nr:DNA double-strand break repair nuclease NurA [Marinifilum fragile]